MLPVVEIGVRGRAHAGARSSAPSSEQAKLEPSSFDENSKLALASFVSAGGADVIVVSGGVVSIVQVKLAALASVFPAASVASTANVCSPSSRSEYETGLSQVAYSAPSSEHSKLEPFSFD